jgi:hypothetical protein
MLVTDDSDDESNSESDSMGSASQDEGDDEDAHAASDGDDAGLNGLAAFGSDSEEGEENLQMCMQDSEDEERQEGFCKLITCLYNDRTSHMMGRHAHNEEDDGEDDDAEAAGPSDLDDESSEDNEAPPLVDAGDADAATAHSAGKDSSMVASGAAAEPGTDGPIELPADLVAQLQAQAQLRSREGGLVDDTDACAPSAWRCRWQMLHWTSASASTRAPGTNAPLSLARMPATRQFEATPCGIQ